ncbi:MAG: tetratricopeptide repeat protein [Pirellulales bacterium]
MADYSRIRRQQLVREAEGYLELANMFAKRWPLPQPLREKLAERALETLSRATLTGSNRAQVLLLIGQANRVLQRYPAAIEALLRSADQDGENLAVWLALASCYKRIDRLDLAIETLEHALRVDDESAIVHYNLACYWSLSTNPAAALHYLAISFELDPRYRERVATEPDFDPLRGDRRFQALMSRVGV